MVSIFDGKKLEERIMRLTRNRKIRTSRLARVMMPIAVCGLIISAMSLTLFSLELRTQAQVRSIEPIQPSNTPASQNTIAANVTTSQSNAAQTPSSAPSAEERALAACKAGHRGDVEVIPTLIAQLSDDTKVP